MFDNTMDVAVDGTTYTLTRVNQDNYGSEYRYRQGHLTLKFRIRHNEETDKNGVAMQRHNVYMEYSNTADPAGVVYSTASTTLRSSLSAASAVGASVQNEVSTFFTTNVARLQQSES